jgi:hypothetical protein
MHALHHGGILARTGNDFVFCGAATEPAIALQSQTRAVNASFFFDAPLNEQMITKNLGYRSVFLEHFALFASFFWEAV